MNKIHPCRVGLTSKKTLLASLIFKERWSITGTFPAQNLDIFLLFRFSNLDHHDFKKSVLCLSGSGRKLSNPSPVSLILVTKLGSFVKLLGSSADFVATKMTLNRGLKRTFLSGKLAFRGLSIGMTDFFPFGIYFLSLSWERLRDGEDGVLEEE